MTTPRKRPLALVFLLLAAVWPQPGRSQAGIELAPVFGDHMVLQRGVPIPVWGTAEPGSEILVGMGTRSVLTKADAEGRWSVVLPPRAPSKESTQFIVASGAETITVRDVLVGEIWLCSGQSNMRWPLGSAASAAEELPAADHPRIRLLNQPGAAHPANRAFSDEELARCNPQEFFAGEWTRCSPSSAEDFSAVAYFFGRRLHVELDVPIGLIHDAVGGSPTQAWIRREALEAEPRLRPFVEQGPDCELAQPWCRERAGRNLERWSAAATRAREQGEVPPPRPGHPFDPSFLWEAGIAPLVPFALRGVIWYQGESNADDPQLHDVLFPTLIRDWRRAWGADFPFLFVQLSALATREGWPEFRDGQRKALSLANTGMAVTIDVGHRSDVHPRDKRTVGERLARWALATTYGREVVPSGPLPLAGTRQDDRVVLRFRHVAGGLVTRGGEELRGFTIAGRDRVFHPAEARIVAATVEVSSDVVEEPALVRYAWAPYPDGNLYNTEGMPASPFEISVEMPRTGAGRFAHRR